MVDLADLNNDDILVFVLRKGEARWKDLEEKFVKSENCVKQTLVNRLNALQGTGRLEKIISTRSNKPVYRIREEYRDEIDRLGIAVDIRERAASTHSRIVMRVWLSLIDELTNKLKDAGIPPEAYLKDNTIILVPREVGGTIFYDLWASRLEDLSRVTKEILEQTPKIQQNYLELHRLALQEGLSLRQYLEKVRAGKNPKTPMG